MAKSTFPQHKSVKREKLSIQHVLFATVLMVVLFLFFQLQFIPYVVSSFVVPLFKPNQEVNYGNIKNPIKEKTQG